jgi:hypothetical protein
LATTGAVTTTVARVNQTNEQKMRQDTIELLGYAARQIAFKYNNVGVLKAIVLS